MHHGLAVTPLAAAFLDPGRPRVLRPALRAGRLDINMATRKKHTPEQVVRKLATADREPPPRQVHDLDRRRAQLVFTVLTYGPSPLYGPPLVRNFSSPDQQTSRSPRRAIGYARILSQDRSYQHRVPDEGVAVGHQVRCGERQPRAPVGCRCSQAEVGKGRLE